LKFPKEKGFPLGKAEASITYKVRKIAFVKED
jgi:hypothetical protein